MLQKIRVAIFASGSGSNAENLVLYFKNHPRIEIASIYCNNPNAYVIERSKNMHLPCYLFSKEEFTQSKKVLESLKNENVDFIVLAGFLWLIPKYLIEAYRDKIINIHPALLPKYGGKGMYGAKVHESVVLNKDKETGISIHYVNELYDEGSIIFQAKTAVEDQDDAESIARKVHQLEYEHFPIIVEQTIFKIF